MHSVRRVKYTTDFTMLAKTNPILAITLTATMFFYCRNSTFSWILQ